MASIKELQAKLDALQSQFDSLKAHSACATGMLRNVQVRESDREDAAFQVTGMICQSDKTKINGQDAWVDLPPTNFIASAEVAQELLELSKRRWVRMTIRGFECSVGKTEVNAKGYLHATGKQLRVMAFDVIKAAPVEANEEVEAATEQQGELIPQDA